VIVYLSVAQVMNLHADQLELYGGASGLRDRGSLESALARPAMTFGGEDLYPDVASKAAALMHSLALNHPFVDGNKRVAAHAAVLFALSNGYEPMATPHELFDVTMAVAQGTVEAEALAIWFRQRLRSIE
jgi:death-on-curing protein